MPILIYTFVILLFIFSSHAKIATAEIKILHFDEPFRVSKHIKVTDEAIFDRYNERCSVATGEEVIFNTTKGTQKILRHDLTIRILDLSQLRCEHWGNEWELGTIALGSGGNEWAIIIDETYILRVRANSIDIANETEKQLSIIATTHPTYCENVDQLTCEKKFSFEYFK